MKVEKTDTRVLILSNCVYVWMSENVSVSRMQMIVPRWLLGVLIMP